MEEEPLDDSIVLKPKKPRSPAQLAAFEKAQQKRLANALLKKEALEKAKNEIVVEREKTKKVYIPKAMKAVEEQKVEETPAPAPTPTPLKTDQPPVKKPVPKKEPKIIYEEDSEDDVVIVKKKKKKPKVIYEESSSEDEEPVPRKKPAKKAEPVAAPVAIKPIIKFF
jgi:23S rRNA-/tRNA-specific pseudouridylate synthase